MFQTSVTGPNNLYLENGCDLSLDWTMQLCLMSITSMLFSYTKHFKVISYHVHRHTDTDRDENQCPIRCQSVTRPAGNNSHPQYFTLNIKLAHSFHYQNVKTTVSDKFDLNTSVDSRGGGDTPIGRLYRLQIIGL